MFNTIAVFQKTLSAGPLVNTVTKRLLSVCPNSKMPVKVRLRFLCTSL